MPHQCTDCGTVFADGSTEMLSGCPDCGGNTFQFLPEGADPAPEPDGDVEPPDRGDSVAHSVGSAAATVRDLVAGGSPGSGAGSETANPSNAGVDPETADPLAPFAGEPGPDAADEVTDTGESGPSPVEDALGDGSEDAAQASARSAVVSTDELPSSGRADLAVGSASPANTQDESDPAGQQRPDLQTLREELNDQFESIRIVEPGQYELNLMELYEREEYIIALQEDGRYRIQMPDSWQS